MNDTAHRIRLGQRLALLAGVAALYFLAARFSLNLAFGGSNASPIWPPSGLALAAMLLWGPRVAPGIWVGAFLANASVFLGAAAVSWTTLVMASAFIACGNLGEAMLGSALIGRLRGRAKLESPVDVYVFAGVALVSALVSMGVGCGTLLTLGLVRAELGPVVALTWWLGDVTGMLVLTPLLLWLASPSDKRLDAVRLRRIGLTAAGVALACAVVFGWEAGVGSSDRLVSLLLVLSVVLAAYRHGLGGATLSVFAISCVAVLQTLADRGLFAKATVNDSLISLDGFIVLCVMAGLVVAATARGSARGPAAGSEANVRLPVVVLTGCLGLTLVAWHFIAGDTERRASERFDQLADDIVHRMIERMRTYELTLEGGKGLFDASSSVSREQWRAYVSALALQQRVPGIQGMGFAQHIPASKLEAHERAMRAQGMPDYHVRPPGPRPEYTSIIYLEPFDARNQRAFSYDMFSEPVRREAMVRARDSGQTAVSGRVTLLQETNEAPQAGFLMYSPVFSRVGGAGASVPGGDGLMGFVYAPFRVGDLMRGVLGGGQLKLVYLDLHDGADPSSRQKLFSSYEGVHPSYPKQFTQVRTMSIGGRTWSIDLASTPLFEADVDTQKAQISLVAGTLISLLVFSVMRALMLHRADALALAETMTRERAAAETRLLSLAETAGEAILVAVQGGGIDYCNGAAERMLGHARDELLGRPLEDLVPVDQREAFSAWLQGDSSEPQGAVASRREMVRKDGATLPVEVNVSHWHAKGTRYVGIVMRDITDHLAALSRLEQSKSLFSNVLDNIPAMVGLWDQDLRNRYCNREYGDWFGVTASEAYGRHIREVIGETLFLRNKEHIDQALSGNRVSFERLIHSPNGRTRYSQAHYLPDLHEGVVKGFFVLVFDITPLYTARQALQHNLKLHDLIFHHAGVGIALTRHHHHERVSREFTRLLGYEEGELDGQHSSLIFPDQASYEAMRRLADEVLPAGQPLGLEAFLRSKNGDSIWCHLLARAVDPQDESQGTIWILQDFRDRKQHQELLERARAEAESAAKLKADFLANMSHEIRTPMNGIIGLTALTLESELTPRQRENLMMVQDSALSLLGLLNDILDFSKIEAGKLVLEHAPFDLRDQLSMAVAPSALVAWHKGVEFTIDVAPEVPQQLWGDSLRLTQVVRNLADNAAKFTQQGEIVCKVTHEVDAGGGVRLMVEVTDTGPGIPDATKASIFEAFVQADSSVTRQYGGTGLGLTICAQIVSMMGGKIGVHSDPGEGPGYSFTAGFDKASPAPALDADQAAAMQGRCIGIAVRTEAASKALRRQLTAWGMRSVEPLKTQGECESCDAWIVDGVQDGLNLLNQRARLIMLEGPGGSVAAASPWSHCLRKPVKMAELARVLTSLMSGAPPVADVAYRNPSSQDKAATPLNLLLAEDHPVNQRLALRLLEKRGHRVTLASNGAVAVELAREQPFDLILMDVQMPVMDGVTATRAIREFEAALGRRTPIIALTAHAMQDDLNEMMTQGFDAYLAKPFDPRELAELVSEVAQRSVS